MRLDTSDMRMVRDRTRVSMKYAEDKYLGARRAERMRQWFRGEHYEPSSSMARVLEADRVVVNYSLVNVLVKVAQLAFGEPSFRMKARRKAFKDQIKLIKPVLEYVFRETKAMRPLRRALFDCKVTGTGVVGTNWRFETADMVYTGSGAQGREGVLVYDNPETRRIKPEWWIVDPDSVEDWRNAWYVGEKWQLPLIQMRRHPRYKGIASKLKGTVIAEYADKVTSSGENPADKHLRKVNGYTVYLRDLQCVVDWSDELPDEPLFVGKVGTHYPTDWGGRPYFPYAVIENVPDLKTHYGIGDIEITETQQAEIDLARSQLASVRRQNNGQTIMAEGVMDEDNLAHFQEGVQNAIIVVKGLLPGMKLEDVMRAAPRENIQPEVYASLDKSQMDMSELSRAAAFRRGMTMPGLKYATEAALAAQGVQGLEADERAQFEQLVAEVAEQYTHLLHRWAGELREIELAGGVGSETEWLQWSGQHLAGDFEFTVEQSSMNPPDSQLEEQKWFARLQALVPLAQMGVNPIPLVEAYLNSFDFEDIERVIPQQPIGPVPGTAGGPPMNPMNGGMTNGNQGVGNNLGGDQGVPQAAPGQGEGDLSGLLAALSGTQG